MIDAWALFPLKLKCHPTLHGFSLAPGPLGETERVPEFSYEHGASKLMRGLLSDLIVYGLEVFGRLGKKCIVQHTQHTRQPILAVQHTGLANRLTLLLPGQQREIPE